MGRGTRRTFSCLVCTEGHTVTLSSCRNPTIIRLRPLCLLRAIWSSETKTKRRHSPPTNGLPCIAFILAKATYKHVRVGILHDIIHLACSACHHSNRVARLINVTVSSGTQYCFPLESHTYKTKARLVGNPSKCCIHTAGFQLPRPLTYFTQMSISFFWSLDPTPG